MHRSLTRDGLGDHFEDLTQGGRKGNVAYGTLTTLSESPFQFGYLYTGSDDGLVYKSTNGGGVGHAFLIASLKIYGSVE